MPNDLMFIPTEHTITKKKSFSIDMDNYLIKLSSHIKCFRELGMKTYSMKSFPMKCPVSKLNGPVLIVFPLN